MVAVWILLLVMVVFSYSYYRRDFAGPWFLLCVSIWASFSIVILNYSNWDIRVHGFNSMTTISIMVTVLSFFTGSFLVRYMLQRSKNDITQGLRKETYERCSRQYPYSFFAVLSILLFILYLAIKVKSLNFRSLIAFEYTLNSIYNTEKEYNFLKTQVFEMITAIAYISLHRYMVEKYLLIQKPKKKIIVPIICFLIYSLFSTDRNTLLRFFIFGLTLFVMSYDWGNIRHSKNLKLVRKIGILVLVFAVVFWVYGKLKNYTSDFERAVGLYGGSGLYGYNLWIDDFNGNYTNGAYTFSSIRNSLSALGIGKGFTVPTHFEFIAYKSSNEYVFATNIYSAMRIYYQDYGIIGLVIFPLLTGTLFEFLYRMAMKNKYGIWWLFYASHIYPVIYYPVAEQFIRRFHFGLVYEIFWLLLFYYLVYAGNGLWRVRVVCRN